VNKADGDVHVGSGEGKGSWSTWEELTSGSWTSTCCQSGQPCWTEQPWPDLLCEL